jgi:hypothetical protein
MHDLNLWLSCADWNDERKASISSSAGFLPVICRIFIERAMLFRDPNQTLSRYLDLVRRLDQKRREYDPVSYAQLTQILRRRVKSLTAELRGRGAPNSARRAA